MSLTQLLLLVIQEDLIRLSPKVTTHQLPSAKGSHRLIERPSIFHVKIARPYRISVNLIFRHFTLMSLYLLVTGTACQLAQ